MNQADIDRQNVEFWNELCGTALARILGINDFSAASLEKFDRYYLKIYPYLTDYLQLDRLAGKHVLEVGLGYGTVAQMLAARARTYTGLDIAAGPVDVVNHRMTLFKLPGSAQQGNILEAPFESGSFDVVVTIGCLHHTGNLQRALDEVHRLLRPGGVALVMVYNAFSYRRWLTAPGATWRVFLQDLGWGTERMSSDDERAAYDRSSAGAPAPATVFTSVRRLRRMCAAFTAVTIRKENAERELVFRFFDRLTLLPVVGPLMGLDLYATLRK
jgi:SAM-dependent methyltransferase